MSALQQRKNSRVKSEAENWGAWVMGGNRPWHWDGECHRPWSLEELQKATMVKNSGVLTPEAWEPITWTGCCLLTLKAQSSKLLTWASTQMLNLLVWKTWKSKFVVLGHKVISLLLWDPRACTDLSTQNVSIWLLKLGAGRLQFLGPHAVGRGVWKPSPWASGTGVLQTANTEGLILAQSLFPPEQSKLTHNHCWNSTFVSELGGCSRNGDVSS